VNKLNSYEGYKMKTLIKISYLFCMSLLISGCLSAASYNASSNQLTKQKILASGDQRSIDLLNAGISPKDTLRVLQTRPLTSSDGSINGVVFGVDVSSIDVLKANPYRHIIAALGDAALTYGAYKVAENNDLLGQSDNKPSNNSSTAGRDNCTIIIVGDNNNVTIDQGDISEILEEY